MAIIYSYPPVASLQTTDLFIISRVPTDPDEISNFSVTTDALATFVTARVNLTFQGDTNPVGDGTVNLDTQKFIISGTTNEIETTASNQVLQIGLPDNVTITNNLTVDNDLTVNGQITNNVGIGGVATQGNGVGDTHLQIFGNTSNPTPKLSFKNFPSYGAGSVIETYDSQGNLWSSIFTANNPGLSGMSSKYYFNDALAPTGRSYTEMLVRSTGVKISTDSTQTIVGAKMLLVEGDTQITNDLEVDGGLDVAGTVRLGFTGNDPVILGDPTGKRTEWNNPGYFEIYAENPFSPGDFNETVDIDGEYYGGGFVGVYPANTEDAHGVRMHTITDPSSASWGSGFTSYFHNFIDIAKANRPSSGANEQNIRISDIYSVRTTGEIDDYAGIKIKHPTDNRFRFNSEFNTEPTVPFLVNSSSKFTGQTQTNSLLVDNTLNVEGTATFSGDVICEDVIDMSGNRITNLADPTSAQDAATKSYVDTAVTGLLDFKGTFRADTGEILSGGNAGAYLYNCPGGAGTRVAVAVGDYYIVANAGGSFYCSGDLLNTGDSVFAVADAAADSSTINDWGILESDNIEGSGTANYIPKWTDSQVLGNSVIYEDADGHVGIGVPGSPPNPAHKFEVYDSRDENNAFDYSVIVTSDINSPFNQGTGGIKNQLSTDGGLTYPYAISLVTGTTASDLMASTKLAFYANSDLNTSSATGFSGFSVHDGTNPFWQFGGAVGDATPTARIKVLGNSWVGEFHDTNIGVNASVFGQESEASGFAAFAANQLGNATGAQSASFNFQTTASGGASASFGAITTASGNNSFATGDNTVSSGVSSFTAGSTNTASGNKSAAFGQGTVASGTNATTFGEDTNAVGDNSISAGFNTTAGATNSFVFGQNSTSSATANYSGTFGLQSSNTSQGGFVAGLSNTAGPGNNATAFGEATTASGTNSFAQGQGTTALGIKSFAGGTNSAANNVDTTAIGTGVTANGESSQAFGIGTQSNGLYSFAANTNTQANQTSSFATGELTQANGAFSFAGGVNSQANNQGAVAFGGACQANGEFSFVAGNINVAGGNFSTAFGLDTEASGPSSTALNHLTTASGQYSTAINFNNTASGQSSFAFGNGNTVSGLDSAAGGRSNTVSSENSIVFGFQNNTSTSSTGVVGTTATEQMLFGRNLFPPRDVTGNAVDSQFVVGKHNNDVNQPPTAFVVGTGSSASALENSFTVLYDGKILMEQVVNFNYPDDTAAGAGGVPIGGVYHNAGALRIRIT